jgi:hypothetical protein
VTGPIFSEEWVNPPPFPHATIPAGAPAAGFAPGDPDTWILAGQWAWFPPITAGYPQDVLRVIDIRAPAEIILVRLTAGNVWQVTRGDQGSPVVDHLPGFEVRQLITAEGLTSLAQGTPAGTGLVLPDAANRIPPPPPPEYTWNDQLRHAVAELPVVANEAGPGAVYQAMAWGRFSCGAGSTFEAGCIFGGSITDDVHRIGYNAWPTNNAITAAIPARWRIHTVLNIFAGQAHANTLVYLETGAPAGPPAPPDPGLSADVALGAKMVGPGDPVPVITTADQTLFVYVVQALAGGSVTVHGSKAWRSA